MAVWNLPVLFVCKDDDWAITSKSGALTGGEIGERVRGLGARYVEADGLDIEQGFSHALLGIFDAIAPAASAALQALDASHKA